MPIASPVAAGAVASTARAKARIASLSLGSPLSAASTRARPSGATHSRAISGGIESRVTGPACSAVRRSARSLTSGSTIALATVARCAALPSASRTRSVGEPLGGVGARARGVARGLPQTLRPVAQRRHHLGIARRRLDGGRIQGAPQRGRRRADTRELRLLVGRHEAVDRHGARDLGQSGELLGDRRRGGDRWHQHLGGVRAHVRVAAQVEIGRDRFDLGAAQIDRIEIETQMREQRQAGDRDQQRHDDDRHAMLLEKAVDRRERRVAERLRLARRIEELQQGRQQRDAGEKRDHHADAGDQAELGEAAIVGRQERQEAGRRRGGRERQRRARAACRRCATPDRSSPNSWRSLR